MENGPEKSTAVAILGAAAVDVIVRVKDFPSPDGIVMAEEKCFLPGGTGGNVAEGIARLGYPVRFLGVVGDDEYGLLLRRGFEASRVDTRFIRIAKGEHTASCFIAVNQKGERLIFSLGGAAIFTRPEELDLAAVIDAGVLYIADAFPEVALAAVHSLPDEARVVYCPGGLMVNLGKAFYEPVLAKADVAVFNRVEAQAVTGMVEPQKALIRLMEMGIKIAVITCGAEGAVFCENGQQIHIPAVPVMDVADSTGAGDAFSAGLVAGMLEGFTMADCVRLACEVAAHKIQLQGAREGLPYRHQVARLAIKETN
jgi:ribokinase